MNEEVLSLFEDLRFYIGAFFFLTGSLLVLTGLMYPDATPAPGSESDAHLNLITGLAFIAFSVIGLVTSIGSHWRRLKKATAAHKTISV